MNHAIVADGTDSIGEAGPDARTVRLSGSNSPVRRNPPGLGDAPRSTDWVMTEAHATTPRTDPVFPPGRYGRRRADRRVPRWVPILLILAVVAAGLAITFRLTDQYGHGPYDAELVGFTDVTNAQVVVHFRVYLPAGKSAVCVVRARSRDGLEVGRAEVDVPPNTSRQPVVTYRLATHERPVTGEVTGCSPGH
jgi:hypothetical protein